MKYPIPANIYIQQWPILADNQHGENIAMCIHPYFKKYNRNATEITILWELCSDMVDWCFTMTILYVIAHGEHGVNQSESITRAIWFNNWQSQIFPGIEVGDSKVHIRAGSLAGWNESVLNRALWSWDSLSGITFAALTILDSWLFWLNETDGTFLPRFHPPVSALFFPLVHLIL